MITGNDKSSTGQSILILSDELNRKEVAFKEDETEKLEINNLFVKLNLDTQPLPVILTSDKPVETSFQKDKSENLQDNTSLHDFIWKNKRKYTAIKKTQTKYFWTIIVR